jgi:predicted transcriptional regulator of viral defense system
MLRSTELIIDKGLHNHIIRDSDLSHLFRGSPARRYGLVNKAIDKGELIRLCRGHYTLASKYMPRLLSNSYIANRLVSHSFVSAESALSYHGWIPERVTQTISVCAFGRTKEFGTPMGEFVYYKTPVTAKYFFYGVQLITNPEESIYVASPLRALMDYIYLHKISDAGRSFLVDSLRIDEEHVSNITKDDIHSLMDLYKSSTVRQFLKNLLGEAENE